MSEQWKPIADYGGYYEVSNAGRVRGIDRAVKRRRRIYRYKGRVLKHGNNGRGYVFVQLCSNGKPIKKYVHRLVAETFIDNPLKKDTVNHKNGDTLDNCVTNLEWNTYSENNTHAYRELGRKNAFKGVFGENHHSSKPVIQLTLSGELIRKWASASEASRELGVASSNISKCCRGKLNKHAGCKWIYEVPYMLIRQAI